VACTASSHWRLRVYKYQRNCLRQCNILHFCRDSKKLQHCIYRLFFQRNVYCILRVQTFRFGGFTYLVSELHFCIWSNLSSLLTLTGNILVTIYQYTLVHISGCSVWILILFLDLNLKVFIIMLDHIRCRSFLCYSWNLQSPGRSQAFLHHKYLSIRCVGCTRKYMSIEDSSGVVAGMLLLLRSFVTGIRYWRSHPGNIQCCNFLKIM
jgi:hypothetical protein